MFEVFNETSIEVNSDVIYKVINKAIEIEKVIDPVFSIIIVDNEKIHELNKQYRNIDKSTDVISFALEDNSMGDNLIGDFRVLGDIYVSIDKVKSQAIEYGHSEERELAFLCVHGFLHLLGYDHMNNEDEKVMFERQELILDAVEIGRETK